MQKLKLVFVLIFLLLQGCNIKSEKEKRHISKNVSVPSKQFVNDQFDKFYSIFIADSVFQMNHIAFPLEGGIIYCDSVQKFTKSNWKPINGNFLKRIIKEDSLVISSTDNQIELKLIRPEIGVLNELKFKKIDGVWYLFSVISNAC